MSGNGSAAEAAMVFEKMLGDYLTRGDDDLRELARRRLEALSDERPMVRDVRIGEGGQVSISIGETDVDAVVTDLALAFDSIVEVFSFALGRETAYREAEGAVENARRQFQMAFDKLDVGRHVLGGATGGMVPTGVEGLDPVLGGGVPRGGMIMVLGPPGSAKYQLAYQFLAMGLRHGEAGIVASSSTSIKEVRSWLSGLGVGVTVCEARGLLNLIDWYSHRSRAVMGLEEHRSVLIPSRDMANLDIAFMKALESLAFAPSVRACVDIITPALNFYDLPDVVDFVQRLKTRLKEMGVTSVFVVETEAHDERVVSTLKHLADGIIAISSEGGSELSLTVESMGHQRFARGAYPVQISRRGISVSGETFDLEGVLSELCNIPTVTRNIAQRLVDAGFTDIEKLNTATEEDLRSVSMMTDDVLRNIRDYTRTLEYSRRVLATRSDRWLRKAREQAAAGELERAKKSIERALEIDQSNALAWLELSRINKLLGDDDRSQEYYRRAVAMDAEIGRGDEAGRG